MICFYKQKKTRKWNKPQQYIAISAETNEKTSPTATGAICWFACVSPTAHLMHKWCSYQCVNEFQWVLMLQSYAIIPILIWFALFSLTAFLTSLFTLFVFTGFTRSPSKRDLIAIRNKNNIFTLLRSLIEITKLLLMVPTGLGHSNDSNF